MSRRPCTSSPGAPGNCLRGTVIFALQLSLISTTSSIGIRNVEDRPPCAWTPEWVPRFASTCSRIRCKSGSRTQPPLSYGLAGGRAGSTSSTISVAAAAAGKQKSWRRVRCRRPSLRRDSRSATSSTSGASSRGYCCAEQSGRPGKVVGSVRSRPETASGHRVLQEIGRRLLLEGEVEHECVEHHETAVA